MTETRRRWLEIGRVAAVGIAVIIAGTALAGAALPGTAHARPAPAPPPTPAAQARVTVDVVGGSRLAGLPAFAQLPFVTRYGRLQVPAVDIDTMTATGDGETFTLTMTNGDVVRGAPDSAVLAIETLFGAIEVPLQHLREARFVAAPRLGASAYLPVDEAMTWTEAHDHARALGGTLVLVDGPEENRFVTELMAARGHSLCWIGLTDRDAEGRFRWLDGAAPSFTAWHDNEPNDAGGHEDFVHLYLTGDWAGRWNDWNPHDRAPFVIEFDAS